MKFLQDDKTILLFGCAIIVNTFITLTLLEQSGAIMEEKHSAIMRQYQAPSAEVR